MPTIIIEDGREIILLDEEMPEDLKESIEEAEAV